MRTIQRKLQPGERIRVLIVDDSAVVRRLLTRALSEHPSLLIVGTAANGELALQRVANCNPDVVTLDIEMPEMNGLEVLQHIRRDYPDTRVVMFSTLTERGASMTLEALTLGADDYITKSSLAASGNISIEVIQQTIIPKITQFFPLADENQAAQWPAAAPGASAPVRPRLSPAAKPKIVVIGVSTGGPTALGTILPQIPANFPLPILIVQHMPPLFTRLLSERLNAACALQVEEATQGAAVQVGRILVAPGDFHMKVALMNGDIGIALEQSAPQNFCRPAVDVLFHSVAEVYGGSAVAVVLTGMGQDGLRGAEVLKANGAYVLAQDKATSVVWGMPGAVITSGIADRVLSLQQVAPELIRIAEGVES